MTARYSVPSIEAILEDPEDEPQGLLRGKDEDSPAEAARRRARTWFESESNMSSAKAHNGKEKERSRKHRSSTSGSKHQAKSKPKSTSTKRASGMARDGSDAPRPRHRRTPSNRSTSSTSSSEEDEPVQDHRVILAAARARLTSPSMVSTYTTLTNSTNKSSGSSGSNSTVTQASVTKRSSLGKRPEIEAAPLSPAVPDAPDVFAFLETECSPDDEDESENENENQNQNLTEIENEDENDHDNDNENKNESESESESEEEQEQEQVTETQWPPSHLESAYVQSALPPRLSHDQASSSSSAASSFHGEDDFSSPPADNDTDRSTSPERSIKGHDSEHESSTATDPVSVKIASQMAAAQQRQNLYESMQQFGTPSIPRVNTNLPHVPSSALTPRNPYQHQASQRPLPRVEKLPVTGYELLASRLSCHNPDSEDGAMIKPMYRKFEALNHRLLLHLQDEISELEEQLHRLDHADTQSRRTERHILPASRRAAAQAGGELQWHKTDVLGRIGYKLAQYNQALSSFNTTQSLNPPDPDDISVYRTYLQTENPIAEAETHFLDPTDDLVSVYSDNLRPPPSNQSPSYAASNYSNDAQSAPSSFPASPVPLDLDIQQNALQGLATAVAVSVLVPILTFNVIPGFVGRLTVTALVASGVIGALVQSGILGRGALFGKESITCAGIYGGVMIVIAGIMG